MIMSDDFGKNVEGSRGTIQVTAWRDWDKKLRTTIFLCTLKTVLLYMYFATLL